MESKLEAQQRIVSGKLNPNDSAAQDRATLAMRLTKLAAQKAYSIRQQSS